MDLYSSYASIILNSLLKIKEGDALSINTEESDFEFAKILADMAVRITKTVVKIVSTNNGIPSDVLDFEPYEPAISPSALCMLHLNHLESNSLSDNEILDVIVDKDDLKAVQKLGHLADPIILDRRIVIAWCVVPAYYINDPALQELVNELSNDFDGQVLACKYRKKFLNHADIDKLHFFSENCDFTVDIPENVEFIGGTTVLSSGRDFINGIDFKKLICNVDKNSLNGWFNADVRLFGKNYKLRLEFNNGVLVNNFCCKQLTNILSFDKKLSMPGFISLDDKDFSLIFGCSSVDSLINKPELIGNLPAWFNDSIYKFECRLDSKLNIEYIGCDNKFHELVRKGFFLE